MSIAGPGMRQMGSSTLLRLHAEMLEDRRMLAPVNGSTDIGHESGSGQVRDLRLDFSYAEIRDHVRVMIQGLEARRTSLSIPPSTEHSDSAIDAGIEEAAIATAGATLVPVVQSNQTQRSAQNSFPRQALAGAIEGQEVVVVADGSAATPARKRGWVCLTPNSQVIVTFSDQMVVIERDEDTIVYDVREFLFFESFFGNSHITFANLPTDSSIHVEAIGFASTTAPQVTA